MKPETMSKRVFITVILLGVQLPAFGWSFTGVGSNSVAKGVSADGQVVVGWSNSQAFRWTQTNGMETLGLLGGGTYSFAYAASMDGAVIVGQAGPGQKAFRWTAATGMVGLGSGSLYANAVSWDGQISVGRISTSVDEAVR